MKEHGFLDLLFCSVLSSKVFSLLKIRILSLLHGYLAPEDPIPVGTFCSNL